MNTRPHHFRRPASKGTFATGGGARLRSGVQVLDPAPLPASGAAGATAAARAIIDPVTRQIIGWLTG